MILTLGDSYTYGYELSNPTKDAWPVKLADSLACDVKNLGIPGGSNDRIFRLAVSELVRNTYDIVICAWTEVSRLDLTANGQEFQVTGASTWHHDRFPWIKEYYANHYSERHAVETWLTKVIALQEFFKARKQKYIFVNMNCNWDHANYYKELGLEHLVNSIDKTYYPGWDIGEGLSGWQGDCPKGPGGHPLELGHQRIAEKFYEHIRYLGWIS